MRTPRIAVDDPLPPRKRKKKMEKLQDRGLGRAAVCQRRTKRSVRNFFLLEMSASMDWASRTGRPGTMVESHWMREKAGETVWGVTKKIPRMEDEESNTIVSD